MTKEAALIAFKELFPHEAFIWKGSRGVDKIARSETWNNYTDALCKNGRITLKQYETWVNPF